MVAGDTAASLGLGLQETKITVLGPEKDIDHFYLGKDIDQRLRGLTLFEQERRQSGKPLAKPSVPFNIGAGDFAKLQARMLSDAFAFAKESGEVINLFAENVKEEYEKNIKKYFKNLSMTCAQNKIKYVPVNVGADFEKILTTYLVEKQNLLH